jgi:GNAT superfamily N-acetyltransferase
MDTSYSIERVLLLEPDILNGLAEVTLDVVEDGASVGFMDPFTLDKALKFWDKVKLRLERKEIVLLVAKDRKSDKIIGTVQLIIDLPENQPHRADVAKMQVHRSARRLGIGEALLKSIEKEALNIGRTLLVLDTATGSDAQRLYEKLGWIRVGDIPEYALWPKGELCSSTFFYRKLSIV